MINIYIITPFPDIVESVLNTSILGKAIERKKVIYNVINLFDYRKSDSERIDDYPFGGGAGMILKSEPIIEALGSIKEDFSRVIFPTPDGNLLNHDLSLDLSKEKTIIFICGHYKGVDQRIRDKYVTDEISIGDYVLTGGELPSLVIIDSLVRLIPGVLNTYESAEEDSFFNQLLDGPHYTRPREVEDMKVPDVLLSGNHQEIKKWFLIQRENKTKIRRLDLWNKYKSLKKNRG